MGDAAAQFQRCAEAASWRSKAVAVFSELDAKGALSAPFVAEIKRLRASGCR
jgi:hypothetical protein